MNLDFLNDTGKPWRLPVENLSPIPTPAYASEETATAISKWNADNEVLIAEKTAIATELADLKNDLLSGKNTGPTFRENRRALLARETDVTISEWRHLARKEGLTEAMGKDFANAQARAKDALETEEGRIRSALIDLNGSPDDNWDAGRAIEHGLRDHPGLKALRTEVAKYEGRWPEAATEDDKVRGRAIHARLIKLI